MKRLIQRHTLVLGLAALALCLIPARAGDPVPAPDAPATAAADQKAARKAEREKKLLEKYDANHNGQLDPEEQARLKADRKAAREKRLLAKYDANHNGKLDPEEQAQLEADRKAAAEKRKATREVKAGAEAKDQPESEEPEPK